VEKNKEKGNPSEAAPEAALFADLKRVILEELDESDRPAELNKAFHPLTDGLGLDSPRKPPQFPPVPSRERKTIPLMVPAVPEEPSEASETSEKAPPKPKLDYVTFSDLKSVAPPPIPAEEKESERKKFAQVMEPIQKEDTSALAQSEPPPLLPRVKGYRRMLAALMDQVFVLTFWLLAVAITLKTLTGSAFGLPEGVPSILESPLFLKFALMEFFTIWLCYFVISIGVLDTTFGMWVWGIRVNYRTGSRVPSFVRKMVRATLSFLFYAPVAPLLLLSIVGRRGRNLLDTLSGSSVYQVA